MKHLFIKVVMGIAFCFCIATTSFHLGLSGGEQIERTRANDREIILKNEIEKRNGRLATAELASQQNAVWFRGLERKLDMTNFEDLKCGKSHAWFDEWELVRDVIKTGYLDEFTGEIVEIKVPYYFCRKKSDRWLSK